jgi:hypothetical protein
MFRLAGLGAVKYLTEISSELVASLRLLEGELE